MYLDEGLVKNMSSFVLNGYIDIRTTKLVQDKTVVGNIGADTREQVFDEDRYTEDERQGYRGSNCVNVDQSESVNNNRIGLENRDFIRREEEIKRVFTTFNFHGQLLQELDKRNSIKYFDNTTINEGDLSAGDYVQIRGNLTSESVNSYIDSLLNVFDCFGCDCLNKIEPIDEYSALNFNSIQKFMQHLNTILNQNSTQDMILNCGETPIILNVNNNFFMNNNAYIYDKIDCPCTVFGKVIKIAPNGQCISLLRKTAQHSYYENMLNVFTPFCKKLSTSGIVIPNMPRLKCEGISVVVVPISISM